jgi:protein O-GlcNAc transferase
LPIVTCSGQAFASRMAGSLLHTIGLTELVTGSLHDYEALALQLARDPSRLATVKAKLVRNRDTCPLFDSARFARHLESAFVSVKNRWLRGEPTESFAVEPIDLGAR